MKKRNVKKLQQIVSQLDEYEQFLLMNGVELTAFKYPHLDINHIINDFAELKLEIKSAIRAQNLKRNPYF